MEPSVTVSNLSQFNFTLSMKKVPVVLPEVLDVLELPELVELFFMNNVAVVVSVATVVVVVVTGVNEIVGMFGCPQVGCPKPPNDIVGIVG